MYSIIFALFSIKVWCVEPSGHVRVYMCVCVCMKKKIADEHQNENDKKKKTNNLNEIKQ